MRRREFLGVFGGVAATWPLAVRAQQPDRMRRIEVLMDQAQDDPDASPRTGQRSCEACSNWAGPTAAMCASIRAGPQATPTFNVNMQRELVALAPDVILATASPTVAALQAATRTVPIVFAHAAGDPVGAGFIDSLARPGGKRHWVHLVRIQHQREMAGVAQRARAPRDAGGCASGPRYSRRDGPIWCHPIRGGVVRSGIEADQRA